jgi:hypothetical protein
MIYMVYTRGNFRKLFPGWGFKSDKPQNISNVFRSLQNNYDSDEFNRLYQNYLYGNTNYRRIDRRQLYQEYTEMETYSPLIGSYLDVLAEDATQLVLF